MTAKFKLTQPQQELLLLLTVGPRYGFTDCRVINALVKKGLAHQFKGSYRITAAGRRVFPPPPKRL